MKKKKPSKKIEFNFTSSWGAWVQPYDPAVLVREFRLFGYRIEIWKEKKYV